MNRTKGKWYVRVEDPMIKGNSSSTAILTPLEKHPLFFSASCQEETVANAEFICKAVNNYEELVNNVKRIVLVFDNEAGYPAGTLGYTMCKEAKKFLDDLNEPHKFSYPTNKEG